MKIILEYVWLDGHMNLRSKYKTMNWNSELTLDDIPIWNYDGSSTFQATTENSEVLLLPVAYYKNPFFTQKSYLVMCETYEKDGLPTSTNHRHLANQIFTKRLDLEPWFGIEQEYFMTRNNTVLAFEKSIPAPQGHYYCGVGEHIQYRDLVEQHYNYCLYAGLEISGVNAEVAPNQWEYQIGPCTGIDGGDQLWISRYILQKVAEKYGISISFCPKPLSSPWNGSGLHINVSTKKTRDAEGITFIEEYMNQLKLVHHEHLAVYGDNSLRLSGECETSDKNVFSWGYGDRRCSIRIPTQTVQNRCGYFEDRRPASDADPYQATGILFETICRT